MSELRKNVGDRLTAVDQLMLHIECGFDMPDLEDLNDEAQRLKKLAYSESAIEERERCIRIVSAARSGAIGNDLRCVIAFIESGDQMRYADGEYFTDSDWSNRQSQP